MKTTEGFLASTLIPFLAAVFLLAFIPSFKVRIALALVTAAWVIAAALLLEKKFNTPVRKLLQTMKDGHSLREKDGETSRLIEKYPSAAKIARVINSYVDGAVRKNSAEIFSKQTELLALQSQINPHFLFNTLDSIRGEAYLHDDDEVAEMLETLASFFRYSISKTGNMVRLRDEIRNVQNYMKIQEHRFRNRFHLEILSDESDASAYDCYVPKLILQPIVENSIYHGLEELPSGGLITVDITKTEDTLILTVSDNGKGMPLGTLKELNDRIHDVDTSPEDRAEGSRKSTGIALPNVNRRIQILYGTKYGLEVYSSLGQGTEVEIVLPCITVRDMDEEDEEGSTENQ